MFDKRVNSTTRPTNQQCMHASNYGMGMGMEDMQ